MLFSFLPLIVFGLLIWGVVRLMKQAVHARPVDPAVFTRQLVLFGLLFITMMSTALGISWLLSAAGSVRSSNSQVAESLALLALGVPATAALLYFADKRLRESEDERTSGIWILYFTSAASASLLGAMVNGYNVIESWADPGESMDGAALATMVVWLAIWALHWIYLRHRHGVPGDLHQAIATIMGLVPLAIGQAGLTYVLAADVYHGVVGSREFEPRNESSEWLALFCVGSAVWLAIWLRSYESAERTTAWYTTVLPVGALSGVVAVTVAVARFLYLTSVWFVGDPGTAEGSVHFEEMPALIGVGGTGAALWIYHRAILGRQHIRTNTFRTYDYLVLFSAVVSTVAGAVIACSALFGPDDRANLALTGLTFLATGAVIGSHRSHAIHLHQKSDDGGQEIRSSVRRTYFYAMLGLGGLVLLGSGVSGLQGLFEALLEDRLTTQTLIDNRQQIATLIFVGAAVAIHGQILHHERSNRPAHRSEVPQAEDRLWPHRVIVLTRDGDERYDHLAHPESTVEYWHRVDPPPVPETVDPASTLDEKIGAQLEDNVLVLVEDGVPLVIPFHE